MYRAPALLLLCVYSSPVTPPTRNYVHAEGPHKLVLTHKVSVRNCNYLQTGILSQQNCSRARTIKTGEQFIAVGVCRDNPIYHAASPKFTRWPVLYCFFDPCVHTSFGYFTLCRPDNCL